MKATNTTQIEKTLIAAAKKELRKISKGNHSAFTMKGYLEVNFPSLNPADFKDYIKELLNKKMEAELGKASYSGRNIRFQ